MRLFVAVAAIAGVALLWWAEARWRADVPRRAAESAAERGASTSSGPGATAEKEARDDPEFSSAGGVVEGHIRGKYGAIWGVRVAAVRGVVLLAETTTGTDGRYRLDVPSGTEFVLLFEPPGETGLPAVHREGVWVQPGQLRTEDHVFAEAHSISGRLVDEQGAGVADVVVVALHESHWPEDDGIHPDALKRSPAEADGTDAAGVFRIDGLESGTHRLFLRDHDWMLAQPVIVGADAKDVAVVAVRALTLNVRAQDAATRWSLQSFQVHVRFPGGPKHVVSSRGGFLRRRIPHGGGDPEILVTARGYVPATPRSRGTALVAALRSTRLANLRLVARNPDGTPYTGAVSCSIHALAVALERTPAAGVYQGTLPPGQYSLTYQRSLLPLSAKVTREAALPETGRWEEEIVFPRGGTVILRRDKAEKIEVFARRLDAKDPRPGSLFHLSRKETVLEDVAPGRYTLGAFSRGWSREFTVGLGETVIVDVPD